MKQHAAAAGAGLGLVPDANGHGHANGPASVSGRHEGQNGGVADGNGVLPNGHAEHTGEEEAGSVRNARGSSGSSSSSKGGAAGSSPGSSGSSKKQDDVPPPWLRVTAALQYLVTDSKLVLAAGVPKSGLMGFTDPAPHIDTEKQLYVAFSYKGHTYEAVVGDREELVLPSLSSGAVQPARVNGSTDDAGSTTPRVVRGTPATPVSDAALISLLQALHQEHVVGAPAAAAAAPQPKTKANGHVKI